MNPYEEGYRHAANGGRMGDNLYPIYSRAWYEFNEGFDDGRYEAYIPLYETDDGYIEEVWDV